MIHKKITITMTSPYGTVNKNGKQYSEGAIIKAAKCAKNIPIYIEKKDENGFFERIPIGATNDTSPKVSLDSENQICRIDIDGMLFNSGAEIIINSLEDNIITDLSIKGISILKEEN